MAIDIERAMMATSGATQRTFTPLDRRREDRRKEPRDAQWEAVRDIDAHLLVAAGAGTGKTFTVIAKILYLLGATVRGRSLESSRRLQLREIAAITYTNQAAAKLKSDLREELRKEPALRHLAHEVDGARIGTIHSFCGEILRELALRAGRAPGMRVLEEGEGLALAAEVIHETLLSAIEDGTVEGLTTLLAEWPVRDVERWVTRLATESDRLAHLAALAHGAQFGDRERTLLELARRSVSAMSERLGRDAVVDFDRMIVWTRDLLRDHPQARAALQRRIRVLIVDEFQDVDPVQRDIAYWLGGLRGPTSVSRVECTRLMLVGDPKQSIYRFRRADVTVWRETERDFVERGLGRVVSLDESFRSVAPVLAFVDAVIGPIIARPIEGDELQDFEVPYQSVKATRTDGATDRAVELILVPPGDDGKARKAEDVRRIESEAVARRAVELHEGGVRWGDMALLVTAWEALDLYEGALRRQGVPTYALKIDGFDRRREVMDLVLALEAVRDPRDDRALMGFLRSPFVGVADETLLAIARHGKRPYWDSLGDVDCAERELLARGMALLRSHVELRDRVPSHVLLESILEESGYLAHLALEGADGLQPLANVRKLVRLARERAELGVGALLRELKQAWDQEVPDGNARLYGESDDVVTITSVHSAKGLEWPVVFWCDLVRGRRSDYDKLVVGRDLLVLGEPDVKASEQSNVWQAVFDQNEQECSAEQKRLWYVASTRAKDRLILSGIPQGESNRLKSCPAGELRETMPSLVAGEPAAIGYRAADGRSYEAIVSVADPSLVSEEIGEPVEGPVEPVDSVGLPLEPIAVAAGRGRHSATSLMEYQRCPRRHWFKYVMGLREPDFGLPDVGRGGVERGAGPSAVVRGQVVHDVLERLEEEAELDRLLEDAIGRWDPEAPAPEGAEGREYRAALREEIELVSTHPGYRAIADRAGARRELGFVYVAGEDAVVEGKIDLAAPGGSTGGLTLLDVKTGQLDGGGAAEHAQLYAIQRTAYVAAVQGIGGGEVREFRFHSSRSGEQAPYELMDEGRTRAAGQLLEKAREIELGKAQLTRHPEECERCGYLSAGWCRGVVRAD